MPRYQSIFDRVSLLISANVNALLDRALGANSIAVFDEYVNRMNRALDALDDAEGIERGRAKTLTRQIGDLDSECSKLDSDVDRLLAKGERALAAARQSVLNTKIAILQDLRDDLTRAQEEIARLADSRAKLASQIQVVGAKRQQLVSLIEQKRATELRVKAQEGARIAGPDRLRTDDLLERARQELEAATGRAEVGAATLDARIDEILGADEVEYQLQMREAKLIGSRPPSPELADPSQ